MKQRILFIVVCIIMFNSCNKKVAEMFFISKTQRNLLVSNKIVECINAKDVKNLYEMFSKNVRNTQPKLTGDVEKMLSYLNGEVYEYDKFGITENFEKNGFQKKIYYYSTFKLNINNETFIMDYIYTLKNDFDIDEEGINSLKIIKEKDQEKYFCYFQDLQQGIFIPKD